MTKISRLCMLTSAASLCCIGFASKSYAQTQLITNGGFESGFTGWTETDQAGGSGSWFIQSGSGSPVNGFPVQPPPQGTFAAMTDQGGPGSHQLIQSFVVPGGVTSATLSYYLFFNNQSTFSSPNSLDYTTPSNQQGRVDILTGTALPESLAPSDVLENIYQTEPGDPPVSGYTLETVDVTSLLQAQAGNTLQLRFDETDNQLFIDMGIDGVSLLVSTSVSNGTPEPGTVALLVGMSLTGGLAAIRRRRAR